MSYYTHLQVSESMKTVLIQENIYVKQHIVRTFFLHKFAFTCSEVSVIRALVFSFDQFARSLSII